MGYLTINGILMTYSEYKDQCDKYKWRGLLEFLDIHREQKDKHRERRDLHWGEEMEYILFQFNEKDHKLQLTDKAFDLIHKFNDEYKEAEISLHPEFGNWMAEAVPSQPYGAYEDLENLLTCFEKINTR